MAEGGYENPGFGEGDPLLEDTDDRDDDDRDEDTTMPFQPNGASTPGAPSGAGDPMTTNLPTERGPETSFTEGLPDIPGGFSSTTLTAVGQLDKEFPDAKKENIKYRINTKNDKLQVGLIKPGKPYYDLATKKPGTDKYQINPSLPKEVLKELGVSRRQTLGKEIKKLSDDIFNNKKIAEDEKESQTERNKARKRAKRQIAKRTDSDYDTTHWETIALEEFQQNQEERLERQKEIQHEREEQEKIVNDENEEPVVRERARERIEELEIENNQIENENERELERLPFRERLRERVKEIFKKYRVTVTAILLAAGVTIGAVIGAITNSLKALGKGVGNGLKEIGKNNSVSPSWSNRSDC